MWEIKRNKASLKDCAEDLVFNWDENIVDFLREINPKKWRQAVDYLQEAFKQNTESILDSMYDEIGWDD